MNLGEKLKKIRTEKKFSLQNLAEKTGLSRSFLSQVERNKTSPSLSSLIKITSSLGINIGDLFLKEKDVGDYIVHENERESFSITKDKLKIELLTPRIRGKQFDPMFVRFGADGNSGMLSAPGPYFCLLLEGNVELAIGGKVYILEKGDSIYLNLLFEHRWKNIGKSEALAFVVAGPPVI